MLSGTGSIAEYHYKGRVTRTDWQTTGAEFSACETYRYSLWRRWDVAEFGRPFVVIGLNPSTADERQDDPTITRCINFAKREECNWFIMLNLFAYRATDPKVMKAASDPVGPDNDRVIHSVATLADRVGGRVVAAWGAHGTYRNRHIEVLKLLAVPVWCFGKTKNGHPKHPLYLRNDTPLERYA